MEIIGHTVPQVLKQSTIIETKMGKQGGFYAASAATAYAYPTSINAQAAKKEVIK